MANLDAISSWWLRGADVYYPLVAVQFIFETSSPTITSVSGIVNVPGVEIQGALKSISTSSQEVFPEEGRAVIGGITIEILDDASPIILTEHFRDQLQDTTSEGIRDKEIRVFLGYDDDFNNWEQVGSWYVDGAADYKDGVYRIKGRDTNKFLRTTIFEPVTGTLASSITATDTTITLTQNIAALGFEMLSTPASYTDGASGTYGWIRIKDTGEVIRYSGISGNSFTGCSRGRFRTKPEAIELDVDDEIEIEEFIYIELPAILAARALMTGYYDPTQSPEPRFPDHWHAGMSLSDLTDAWDNVGVDLYDPTDTTAGFPVRFTHLDAGVDAKAFIEREIFRLAGVYAPINAYGKFGLRRVNPIIGGSTYVALITPQHLLDYGSLEHRLDRVRNQFTIDYNYDGEDTNRRITFVDAVSVNKHGATPNLKFTFLGLAVDVHTNGAILNRLQVLRDRYAEPPLVIKVTVPITFHYLELGDVVVLNGNQRIKDFSDTDAADGSWLKRSFEVQKIGVDYLNGKIDLTLFASTRTVRGGGLNQTNTPPISNSWYSSVGTNIAGLGGYNSSTRTLTGYTFAGSATDLNASSSIFYFTGGEDLTLSNCNITGNVQLRIRGTLIIDGVLDGSEGGPAGMTDPDTLGGTSTGWSVPANDYSGALPSLPGGPGLWTFSYNQFDYDFERQIDALTATAYANPSLPLAAFSVNSAGNLTNNFPRVLNGTPGGTGGQHIRGDWGTFLTPDPAVTTIGTGGTVRAKAGSGGKGGAGLCIVCRGGPVFNPSAYIDLSGGDGSPGNRSTTRNDVRRVDDRVAVDYYPRSGGGAGGAPGFLYVVLDGDLSVSPDINSSTLIANYGATPAVTGNVYEAETVFAGGTGRLTWGSFNFTGDVPSHLRWPSSLPRDGLSLSPDGEIVGMYDQVLTQQENAWRNAYRVAYVEAPDSGDDRAVPPVRTLSGRSMVGAIRLAWSFNPSWDRVEVFAGEVNDRAFAELVYQGRGTATTVTVPFGGTYYCWARAVDREDRVSEWYPTSSTGGLAVVADGLGQATADELMEIKNAWEQITENVATDRVTTIEVGSHSQSGGTNNTGAWNFNRGNALPTPASTSTDTAILAHVRRPNSDIVLDKSLESAAVLTLRMETVLKWIGGAGQFPNASAFQLIPWVEFYDEPGTTFCDTNQIATFAFNPLFTSYAQRFVGVSPALFNSTQLTPNVWHTRIIEIPIPAFNVFGSLMAGGIPPFRARVGFQMQIGSLPASDGLWIDRLKVTVKEA